MKDIGLHVYRPELLQAPNKDDFNRHIEFCEWFQIRYETDRNFFKSILWSDEATFKLNGKINTHNCVYYFDHNFHLFYQEKVNASGIIVWAGLNACGIIGSIFFWEVNDQRQLFKVTEQLKPVLNNDERFVG